MRFSTKAVHAGQEPDPTTGSVVVPIYQASTFVQKAPGVEGPYVYGRTGNPTRAALETSLAALEGGTYGLAFASGMAAETTLMTLLGQGDHVVASDDLYGGTRRLFDGIMKDFGLSFSYVDATDTARVAGAVTPSTRMVWVESPTNPLLKIIDLKALSRIAHERGLLLVVDNTFMSPYLQRPLDLGADIVVHSTTKYLGGHSDLIGGAIVTSNEGAYGKLKFAQNSMGAVPGPLDCWLVLRGIKTLPLRMATHSSNAMRVAQFLERHPKVRRVIFPGLASHPQHSLAARQMNGFGGIVTFELAGGFGACRRLLTNLRVFLLAESLGGVESLAEHPATMTHASIPPEVREQLGITEGMVRLSVGIEDVEDLIEDLSQALDKA